MNKHSIAGVRLNSIDCLRGIAALAVTFFHLTGSSGLSLKSASYGQYGWLGVQVFFIISGFILPYSLYRGRYAILDFPVFIQKRLIRIFPAYLVTVCIGIFMAVMTNRLAISTKELLGHLLLINSISGYHWISPVFWTLAIEFQFYLLIGLSFPYLRQPLNILSAVWIPVLLSIMIPDPSLLMTWHPFFSVGMVIFFWQIGRINRVVLIFNLALLAVFIAHFQNLPSFLATIGVILFVLIPALSQPASNNRVLLLFGKLSYSLYLVHWEIGRAVVNISKTIPFIGDYESLRIVAGLVASILSAWLMYLWIEKPSLKMSSTLKYQQRE